MQCLFISYATALQVQKEARRLISVVEESKNTHWEDCC
jgi:hypothetical protein